MSSPMPLGAASPADSDAAPRSVCFSVQARAEPGVMPRVVELFAKRGLVPQNWHSTASDEALTIDVQIGGPGPGLAPYIPRCLGQITGGGTGLTSQNPPP